MRLGNYKYMSIGGEGPSEERLVYRLTASSGQIVLIANPLINETLKAAEVKLLESTVTELSPAEECFKF